MNLDEYILNDSHIPNNPLREDIVNEVNNYIGYAYADDINLNDYLTIDKNSLRVSHTRRFYGETREDNIVYYKMASLISPSKSSFTYEPYLPAIDVVVLDFFPIGVLNNFPGKVESKLLEYSETKKISDEVMLGFPVDSFEPSIYSPSELEVVEESDQVEDDNYLEDCVSFIEVPIKNYFSIRNGKITVNKHKLLILALSHYYS